MQPELVAIELTPTALLLSPGQLAQFTALGRFNDGALDGVTITWSATGGAISGSGAYTAGVTDGSFRVIATNQASGFADTASITIATPPPDLVGVELTPVTAALAPGGTAQFSAIGRFSNGSSQGIPISWTATGGTVSPAGLYTAGTVDGAWRVIAASAGGQFADTSTITITTPPPTLVAIEIAPDSARLSYTARQQFTAIGRLSTGATAPVTVTWSTTTSPANPVANSVTGGGVFTAGLPIGRFILTASEVGGSLTASVPVIVHSTAGYTLPPGPAFWTPVPGTVRLCTSNHYTDDGERGGVASVNVSSGGGVVSPSVSFVTDPVPQTYSDGTGEVRVLCQAVWNAPPGLVGDVKVFISVAPTRPGTGIAKVFVYDKLACFNPPPPDGDSLQRPCGRADFSSGRDFDPPGFTTLPVLDSAIVSATTGANIWFKPSYVP